MFLNATMKRKCHFSPQDHSFTSELLLPAWLANPARRSELDINHKTFIRIIYPPQIFVFVRRERLCEYLFHLPDALLTHDKRPDFT